MRAVLLAGGTGAAKLAVGLQAELAPGDLSVITNTGDDCEHHGLHVSPDTDAVLYRLAGIFNEQAGYGIAGDTLGAHEMLVRLGDPGWFHLGDRDLATCLLRTEMLLRGARLTDTAIELGLRLGIQTRVLPMSDDPVRTHFATAMGRLDFQEYFVRERCTPGLTGIDFEGLDAAAPSTEAVAAVAAADLVVIGPSNPLISTGPILKLVGRHLSPARTVAISPIVAGRSLKGPSVEMMVALGMEPTALGVARAFRGLAATYVIDGADRELAPAVEALGYRVEVLDTVMEGEIGARRLARSLLELPPA